MLIAHLAGALEGLLFVPAALAVGVAVWRELRYRNARRRQEAP